MTFQDFKLIPALNMALDDLGFETPSEIQQKAVPLLLQSSGDFVGQAQTGTGKTLAYLLPLLQKIDVNNDHIQCLILAPTRELANQVHGEVEKLTQYHPVRSTTVYGGVSYEKQIRFIKSEKPQIIVGTPGRVIDLMTKKVLKFQACQHLIIDEADEMLNMGFIDDVQLIIDSLNKKRKLWMFSATMPEAIQRIIEAKFSKPKFVSVQKKTLSNMDIDQYYLCLERKHMVKALRCIMDSYQECYGIIFCETKSDTRNLAEILSKQEVKAMALHGDLSQHERDYAMNQFREKKVDLLVCTDVAARGIDVSNITHVFNIGIPRNKENYVHRIGRTGRAGVKGTAISLITPGEKKGLRYVEKITKAKIAPYPFPKPATIKQSKVEKQLTLMDPIKGVMIEKDKNFTVDKSFVFFQDYFKDLDKDQILKLMFTFQFNREIRRIDEFSTVELTPVKPVYVDKKFSKKDRKNNNRRRKYGPSRSRR